MGAVAALALVGPGARVVADDAPARRATLAGLSTSASPQPAGGGDLARLDQGAQRHRYARYDESDVQRARRAIGALGRADPGLRRQLERVAGYVVFAEVGTPGSDGVGVLYEDGQAAGMATRPSSPATLRPDRQPYVELVLLGTRQAVAGFKQGGLSPADQARAVAVVAGTATRVRYHQGVSVLTLGRGGDATGSGGDQQWFGYLPYHREITVGAR